MAATVDDTELFNANENEYMQQAAILEKFDDSQIPGLQVEFDPEEAEKAGAFVEDALSEEEALESSIDLLDT